MALPVKGLKFPDGTEFNLTPDSTYALKDDVPTKLSQLIDDATHRTVSDSEKSSWNNKLDSFTETDPTVPSWAKQVTKPTYTASEVGALPDTTVIPDAYDDSALKERITNLENNISSIIPTEAYNDTAIKERLAALEAHTDSDTIYDDSDIQNRLAALESKTDEDTVYDDSSIKARLDTLEAKSDNDTIYDDAELRNRIETLENKTDKDTIYDDTYLKAHMMQAESDIKELQEFSDNYLEIKGFDDTSLKEKDAELQAEIDNKQDKGDYVLNEDLNNLLEKYQEKEEYEGDGFQDFASDSDTITYSMINSFINLSTTPYDCEYKHGWVEMGKEENGESYQEAYSRIYNAIKYCFDSNYFMFYTDSGYTYTKLLITTSLSTSSGTEEFQTISIYLDDLSLTLPEVQRIYKSYQIDYPNEYWRWCFDGGDYTYLYNYNTSNGTISYFRLPYYSAEKRNTIKVNRDLIFKRICNTIEKAYGIKYVERPYAINNIMYTEKEKVKIAKVIHDYIVSHNDYGDAENGAEDGNQESWSAMSNGVTQPVCAGYAAAFAYCCWLWGITAVIVQGTSQGVRHAWNTVTYNPITILDDEYNDSQYWQDVDLTWDDPVWEDGSNPQFYCRWDYFNKTTATFNEDHTRQGDDGSNFEGYKAYPVEGTRTSNVYRYDNNYPSMGLLYTGF